MLKNYEEAKKFLEELGSGQSFDIKVDQDGHKIYFGGLERVEELLRKMNYPELNYKIIHIVGTAGKGSVGAYLKYFLNEKGFKVGLFSSPSLTTEIEKISIDDLLISPEEFYKTLNLLIPEIKSMKKHFKNSNFSAFEVLTVMSLVYFAREKVDYVILEAGLGGKYDSTHAVKKTDLSLLTTVDLDHTDILGKLSDIVSDKVSVIDRSGVIVTYHQTDEIMKVVESTAMKYSGKLKVLDSQFLNQVLNLYEKDLPKNLITNLALSFFCLENLGFKKSEDIKIPLIKLPARFEIIKTDPDIILDGAHNPIKIKTLVELLKLKNYQDLICVFSCFEDKDYKEMLRHLADVCKVFIFTTIQEKKRKSFDLNYFKEEALKYVNKDKVLIEQNNLKAYALAKKIAKDNKNILITGSFKHVGKIREMWWPEERILEERRIA